MVQERTFMDELTMYAAAILLNDEACAKTAGNIMFVFLLPSIISFPKMSQKDWPKKQF